MRRKNQRKQQRDNGRRGFLATLALILTCLTQIRELGTWFWSLWKTPIASVIQPQTQLVESLPPGQILMSTPHRVQQHRVPHQWYFTPGTGTLRFGA